MPGMTTKAPAAKAIPQKPAEPDPAGSAGVTDDERAELERLRKYRDEQEQSQADRDRAELDALRAHYKADNPEQEAEPTTLEGKLLRRADELEYQGKHSSEPATYAAASLAIREWVAVCKQHEEDDQAPADEPAKEDESK